MRTETSIDADAFPITKQEIRLECGIGIGEELRADTRPIARMFCAYIDLRNDGWKEIRSAPKDGTEVQLIEQGSTGVHIGFWRTCSWWVDGEWPSNPVLWKPLDNRETVSAK